MSEYIEWSEAWIGECFRVLQKDGLVYVYGFPEILARIAVRYRVSEQKWLVWHYVNKAVPSSKFWQRAHESILCLWQPGTRRPLLEVDQIRVPYRPSYAKTAGKPRANSPGRYSRNGKTSTYNPHPNGALPRDVISTPALAGGAGQKERWFMCLDCDRKLFHPEDKEAHRNHYTFKHPTQKPAHLTRTLLKSRLPEKKGKVLIPFAGSGSECVIADEIGAQYLAIDINPEYVEFAQKWVKAASKRR